VHSLLKDATVDDVAVGTALRTGRVREKDEKQE
jgi:hypothetical protein